MSTSDSISVSYAHTHTYEFPTLWVSTYVCVCTGGDCIWLYACVCVCVCCYSKQGSSFLTSLFCPHSGGWLARCGCNRSAHCSRCLRGLHDNRLSQRRQKVTKQLRSGRRKHLVPPSPGSLSNPGRQTHTLGRRTVTQCWMRDEGCSCQECWNRATWLNKYFQGKKGNKKRLQCEQGQWEAPAVSLFYFQFSCEGSSSLFKGWNVLMLDILSFIFPCKSSSRWQ